MAILGIRYVGENPNGISVTLYRSYRTVQLFPGSDYRFRGDDFINKEAENYYNRLRPAQVHVIHDNEKELTAEVNEEVAPEITEVSQSATAARINEELAEDATPAADKAAEDMNEDELVALLESLDFDFKEFIESHSLDIRTGRKSADRVLHELVEGHRDLVLESLKAE